AVCQGGPGLAAGWSGRDGPAGEAPGGMTDFLRRRIPAHLQIRFEFKGPLPRSELFAHYAAATACVFAAPWDNFPLSCVEAMASGACVIGSDHSGMAEMIEHEQSGLLFRAGDTEALASALARGLPSPPLATRLRPPPPPHTHP